MELGEGVTIALIHSEDHDENTCAFCQMATEPTSEENVLTDDADEDADELSGLEEDGIQFKNKARKLGRNLEKEGEKQKSGYVTLSGYQGTLSVSTAAHHIIPGNAALKNSELLDYLHVEGKAKGNIGYDVNNAENGVWLCGNYALRGRNGMPRWGAGGVTFTHETGLLPEKYAFAAIEELKCQFHDAHEVYSEFVKNDLNLLAKKLEMTGDLWCPDAKDKPDNKEDRQMFMLVARLNTMSRRLKTYLVNPGRHWKKNIFTSRFSEAYIKEVIYK